MTTEQKLAELIDKCPKGKLRMMYLDFMVMAQNISMSEEEIISKLKEKYQL